MGMDPNRIMSRIRKLFSVLVLVIEWESKQLTGTSKNTWNTLFLVSHLICHLKLKSLECSLQSPLEFIKEPANLQKPQTVSINGSKDSALDNLPNELKLMILEHLESQETLSNMALVNKNWNVLCNQLLYQCPQLTSINSIYKFVQNVNDNQYFRKSISAIRFLPTSVGTLSGRPYAKHGSIPYTHSGLFRLLIDSRNTITYKENLIHPLFYQLARLTVKTTKIEEFCSHKEKQSPILRSIPQLESERSINMVPSSSKTLYHLLDTCRKWHDEFPEWNGIKDSPSECLETCKLLLEWFQGDFHSIWHLIGSDTVRAVKHLVNNQCRSFLSHLNAALLLQVRFVTGTSQRLLDCYCVIYYRTLALAQQLNVQKLIDCLGIPVGQEGIPKYNDFGNEILKVVDVAVQSEENDKNCELDTSTPTNNDKYESVQKYGSLTNNQQAARCIYEALIIIFHYQLPSNYNSYTEIPISLLRDIIVATPPSSLNGETAELVKRLINVQLSPMDPSTEDLSIWLEWMGELVQWHNASKEMEPVKELLRQSMSKIDILRSIQRRYGIMFME